MSFWTGTPGKFEQRSTLRPDQQRLSQQLVNAGMDRGAGGAFGTAADYYRNLLSDNPEDMDAFAAPELRRFREQIVPQIGADFAGQGSGALSSSAFRNATVNASTDLAERLGAIRASLRQNAAQGLSNIGSQGLQPFTQNFYTPPQPGFLSSIAPGLGAGIGMIAGPSLGGLGSSLSNWFNPKKGSTDPYGGQLKQG